MTKAPDSASQAESDPPVESAPERGDRTRVLEKIVDACARYYRGMTRWLEHDQKHIRVLAYITWLVVLGTFATGFVVMLLKWDPWAMVATITCFTGVTAVGNWLGTRRGPN